MLYYILLQYYIHQRDPDERARSPYIKKTSCCDRSMATVACVCLQVTHLIFYPSSIRVLAYLVLHCGYVDSNMFVRACVFLLFLLRLLKLTAGKPNT